MSDTAYSPYKATNLVNTWIAEAGVEKKLPPQMLYTYVKKGYIASETTEAGKQVVTEGALRTWFDTKYAPKNLGVKVESDEVDPNQLTLDIES